MGAALIVNGITYLQIDDLWEYYTRGQSQTPFDLVYKDAGNKAILSANGHKLEFIKGSSSARLDGRAFRLRAAPFFADVAGHDQGAGEVMYVPLTDLARGLGARFNVNQNARRFYFALPTSKPK